MNPGIFLIQNDEELVEMNEQADDSENLLQSWLAKYPTLLVGNQVDTKEPRRWLFIEEECDSIMSAMIAQLSPRLALPTRA